MAARPDPKFSVKILKKHGETVYVMLQYSRTADRTRLSYSFGASRQRQTKTGWNVCQLSNIIFTVRERYGGSIWSDSIAIESARGLLPYKTRTYFYLFWL